MKRTSGSGGCWRTSEIVGVESAGVAMGSACDEVMIEVWWTRYCSIVQQTWPRTFDPILVALTNYPCEGQEND